MSIDEVRALVAERQRYDEWLAALDARRAETPERVFTRVHGDYSQRRGDVLARLHTHVDALSVLGGELAARLAGLDRELESLEDQRVEAMLRTAVGEYDTQRADTLREDVEAQLARLTDERGSVHMELDDIRALLEQATPARDATPIAVAAVVAEPEPEPAPDVVIAAAPTPETSTPTIDAPPESSQAIEHTETAATVVESAPDDIFGDVHEDMQHDVHADAPSVAHDEAHTVVFDAAPEIPQFVDEHATADAVIEASHGMSTPLAVEATEEQVDDALRLFAETPAHPTAVVAPLHAPVDFTTPGLPPVAPTPTFGATPVPASVPTVPAPSAQAPSAPTAASPAAADPFDDLAFLRSVIEPEGGAPLARSAPEAAFYVPPVAHTSAPPAATAANAEAPQKTLRCTECGTMNLPTEWYCERCGGELATF